MWGECFVCAESGVGTRVASLGTSFGAQVLGHLSLSGELSLMLFPPGREAMKQAELVLRDLVKRHLVFILAALLGKGTDALMDPFVAVDLGSPLRLLLLMWVMLGGRATRMETRRALVAVRLLLVIVINVADRK